MMTEEITKKLEVLDSAIKAALKESALDARTGINYLMSLLLDACAFTGLQEPSFNDALEGMKVNYSAHLMKYWPSEESESLQSSQLPAQSD